MLAGISGREWLHTGVVAGGAFALFGTVTALWPNPFFIRMTPTGGWDWVILALEAVLLGVYLGVRAPSCGVGKAGAGGVLGFLGFGCSICNQALIFLFGASFLLTYFEPVRYLVGMLGVFLLGVAAWRKLAGRAPAVSATPAGP